MNETDQNEIAVRVDNLTKVFKLPHEKNTSIKSVLINFRKRRTYEKQVALNDISFDIKKGEFFGVVGRNGSGKSTLLKLLAGIYAPSKGSVQINGSLTPFIELGVGFNPELTGRENVFLNGALLGFNRKQMTALYDEIVEFAELSRFMDQKLKNYSSGMQVRLAFSIAIRAESDILLLDEVLAVGDAIFQKKCFDYFKQLKKNKRTVVLVSHDANALQEYCDNGILIEKGRITSKGKIQKVVRDYIDVLNKSEERDNKDEKTQDRWGTGSVVVTSVEVKSSESGNNSQVVYTENDTLIKIQVTYKSKIEEPEPVYGITITDASGGRVFQSNTLWSKISTNPLHPGDEAVVEWEVPNVFNTGDLRISPAAADHQGGVMYDWWEDAKKIKIRKTLPSSAVINIGHNITVKKS